MFCFVRYGKTFLNNSYFDLKPETQFHPKFVGPVTL